MSFILEIRGAGYTLPTGGATPDEEYGEDVFGPAIYGAANRTGLSDAAASTFEAREVAYAVGLTILFFAPSLETRIREL